MKLNIVSITMIMGGFLMVYGAIKDRNPISIVQVALQGKPPYDAVKLSTGKAPERQNIKDPSGGIIGTPNPKNPQSDGTNTDWEENSPFPPGMFD